MENIFQNAKFIYPWRKYQQRVLNELDEHLDDDHLHVIAPPGSGKTVLGLEVMLRLNNPTLILSPSIAIKNQWIQRFCDLFLKAENIPDWITTEINEPKLLTVITYQALHSFLSNIKKQEAERTEEDDDNNATKSSRRIDQKKFNQLIQRFNNIGIKTIIADEAHHLKNEWWKSLIATKNELNPIMVCLTATPPYDVTGLEWRRYSELCGPVDSEITVPELIVEDDLCPHQDYVYFTSPEQKELDEIRNFQNRSDEILESLLADNILKEHYLFHPYYLAPEDNQKELYKDIEYYSAILIYLYATGTPISDEQLEFIGTRNIDFPTFNTQWMEILLSQYLYKDKRKYEETAVHRKEIESLLRKNGLYKKHKASLISNRSIENCLRKNVGKLKGILDIVRSEYDQLKEDLRMVILTDYIKKEYLTRWHENTQLHEIGVMPIFERMRREYISEKLCVLTGSIWIIPKFSQIHFEKIWGESANKDLTFSNYPFDDRYTVISFKSSTNSKIVHTITTLFEQGHINIIVGTKSYLGEGWDAPVINSLILATFVGSFVTSNQMRGRAIRIYRNNKEKVSNIWHLVCLNPLVKAGGEDIDLLQKRFKAFPGISRNSTTSIENGIERMALPSEFDGNSSAQINAQMLELSHRRTEVKGKWKSALENGNILIEQMKVPYYHEKPFQVIKKIYAKKFHNNALMALLINIPALTVLGMNLKNQIILSVVPVISAVSLGKLAHAYAQKLKYGDVSIEVNKMGRVLLNTLLECHMIPANKVNIVVKTEADFEGNINCYLDGGSTYENSLFITSLSELIEPIRSPRYIITRKRAFLKYLSHTNFHGVPEVIGKRKEYVYIFKKHWSRIIGRNHVVFTHSKEGRELLLQARIESLKSQFQERTSILNKWQ